MSLIVADAGATTTTWAEITDDQEKLCSTSGINPSLNIDTEIEAVIYDELIPFIESPVVDRIYYYGAGCADVTRSFRIKKILTEAFLNAEITIRTDIEGAGLSAYGNATGIIVISGTGSSAGLMDDGSIVSIMSSDGYPNGDFGSAAHIGATIMNDLKSGKAPTKIKDLIQMQRKSSIDQLFEMFSDTRESKTLASNILADIVVSKVFNKPEIKDYLKNIVYETLDPLFNQLTKHFKNTLNVYSICFVGGTVAVFEKEFREYFQKKDITINKIQRNPIEGMIHFHRNR